MSKLKKKKKILAHNTLTLENFINPIALRKAKIVFGISECNRVKSSNSIWEIPILKKSMLV